MQIFAAIDASASIIKKITPQSIPAPKIIPLLMASALLVGSFFYSLNDLYSRNANKFYADKTITTRSNHVNYLLINTAKAQQIIDPKTDPVLNDIICQAIPTNLSLSTPEIAVYKINELCPQNDSPNLVMAEKPTPTADNDLKEKITAILQNKPMAAMIEPISRQDKIVAAFLVGIALKESALGIHAPHKNGKDCFNYWGYRGKENATAGGYSCFDSPDQAVEIVGGRIKKLVDKNIVSPSAMVVWKCGSASCTGHEPNSVKKWIQDVSIYFNQLNNS